MRVTNQNNEEVSNPFCSLLWKGRQCKSKSNMNKNINLKYSVKGFSDAKATEYFEELRNRIVVNDYTRPLIFIKYGKLNVLNGLKSIISEICDCLIIGNAQAAITLTNHLFENSLKQTLITWDSQGRRFNDSERIDETFKQEVEDYDNRDIEPNIKKCKSKGLITKDEAERLIKLKNIYRNTFSHASYLKLFKESSTVIYSGSLNEPTKIKEEIVDVSKVPFLYLLAQEQFAKKNALIYFLEVYEFIDKMDKKLLDLYPEVKELVLQRENQL